MKKAYVILVVALCCLPMLLFPIAGEKTSAEKRELAAFPSLFEEGRFNASFSQEMDAWDHRSFFLPLRADNGEQPVEGHALFHVG